MKSYELIPTNGRKSFYGKAIVIIDGDKETLLSYGTPIIEKSPAGYKKLWNGWSTTTGTHIKSFCGMDKKQFEAL